MTQEEKAKAYDKAVEIISDYYQKIKYSSISNDNTDREVLEREFPQLKESRDEKIRNRIIVLVNAHGQGMYKDKMLAWLEKQGEHAKFCDSIQVGDKVTRNQDGILVNLSQLKRVAKKDEKQGEKKLTDLRTWKYIVDAVLTEENGIGNYLDRPNTEKIAKKLQERFGNVEQKPVDNKMPCNPDKCIYVKKYREKQKPEWSEEDENGLGDALWAIQQARTIAKDENDMGNLWYAERWLKSLRPQNTWKPSESDILLLERIANGKSNPQDFQASLYGLKEQLKKLREE